MKAMTVDQGRPDEFQRGSDADITGLAAGRHGRQDARSVVGERAVAQWWPMWFSVLLTLSMVMGAAACGDPDTVMSTPTPTAAATTIVDVTATPASPLPTPTAPAPTGDDATKTPVTVVPTIVPTASATSVVTAVPTVTPSIPPTPVPTAENSSSVSTKTPTQKGNREQLVEVPPAGSAPVEYRSAIEKLDRAIESDPGNALAYRRRGLAYFLLGEYAFAADDFNKAVMRDSTNAIAYYYRGASVAALQIYDLAIEDLDIAFELDPGLEGTMGPNSHVGRAYMIRGRERFTEGELDLAIEDYEIAVAFDPDNAEALNHLCWFLGLRGRAAEALPYCNGALDIDPNIFQAHDSRGLVHALLGDYEQAVEDFTKFLDWLGTQPSNLYEKYAPARERWIASLRNGDNPFDEAELEALRNE